MIRAILLVIVFCSFAYALTPVSNIYENKDDVQIEFKNLYDNVQAKQFDIVEATYTPLDLQEGEIVILSSGTSLRLMLRAGATVWASPFFNQVQKQ